MSSSSPLDDVWAKSAADGAEGERLVAHTERVLALLPVLRRRLADVPDRLGATRFWERAELALLAHDLGKVAEGFQRQLRTGQRWGRRHEVLSLAFVPRLVRDETDLAWVAAAVVTHHRDFEEIWQRYDPGVAAEEFATMVAEVPAAVTDGLAGWLGVSAGPLDAGDIATCLREARRLVKVLADDPAGRLVANLLRGVVLTADHAGSAHVSLRERSAVLERASRPASPYPHQVAAEATRGHVVVTAPTGSGKTEAALLWARTQAQDAGVAAPRLFYVLPYQASINAMHARLRAVAGTGAPDSPEVAVVHSRAAQQMYRWLLEDDPRPDTAAARARRHREVARLAVPAARVTTPYQLLKGVFAGSGAEPVLADTAASLLVFDELHAYEPDRLGMILAAMGLWAGPLGGRACVLSATLPTRLLRLLEETLPGVRHVRAEPETFAAFGRHRLRLDARSLDADAVVAACRDAGRGAAVLVVVNRVQRAIELGRAVRAALPGVEVEILHARFCGRDRTRKERNLLERRGPGADEPLVCVATQVVEVSLDVDFDVGLFEVAPFDAVVQRMGRVNRRRRHDRAEVVVFAGALEEPAPYEGVHVEAAWSVLAALGGGAVDEAALGQLLDEAVERAGGQTWEDAVMGARREFERAFVDALPVFDSNDQAARFDELFDGVEVLPAPLRPEYERTLEAEGSLAATELLVPVSARRNWVLRRRGLSRWDRTLQQWVVESAYDPEWGLVL